MTSEQKKIGSRQGTYLSKNTQIHEDLSVIKPPNIGPVAFASATIAIAVAVYAGYFGGGTSSYIMTMEIAYIPEPPMP